MSGQLFTLVYKIYEKKEMFCSIRKCFRINLWCLIASGGNGLTKLLKYTLNDYFTTFIPRYGNRQALFLV